MVEDPIQSNWVCDILQTRTDWKCSNLHKKYAKKSAAVIAAKFGFIASWLRRFQMKIPATLFSVFIKCFEKKSTVLLYN